MYSNKQTIKYTDKKCGSVEYKPYTLFTNEKIVVYVLDGTKLSYTSISDIDEENWEEILPEHYMEYSNYLEERYDFIYKLGNLCKLIIELYVPGGDNIPELTSSSFKLEVSSVFVHILLEDDLKTTSNKIAEILPPTSYELWTLANSVKCLYQNQLALAVNNPAKNNYKKALELLEI